MLELELLVSRIQRRGFTCKAGLIDFYKDKVPFFVIPKLQFFGRYNDFYPRRTILILKLRLCRLRIRARVI